MQLSVSQVDGTFIVALGGDLDSAQAPELEKAVGQAIAGGQRRIVVDLGQVKFIDSSGLATLIKAFKRVRGAGGNLVLAGLQPPVRRVFDLTRLDKVFDIFAAATDAVRGLKG